MIARSATVHKNGQKISQLMSVDGLPPERAGIRQIHKGTERDTTRATTEALETGNDTEIVRGQPQSTRQSPGLLPPVRSKTAAVGTKYFELHSEVLLTPSCPNDRAVCPEYFRGRTKQGHCLVPTRKSRRRRLGGSFRIRMFSYWTGQMSITAEDTIRRVAGCVKVAAVLGKMRRVEREEEGRREEEKTKFHQEEEVSIWDGGHWVDRGESEVLVLDYVDGGPPVGFLGGGG
ncbi:hypothetical protein IWW34DRAFT_786027 [Fusarium oxysporum f. sp. albedinis]|nr:hypothetical protein IWW34DRAFT_786027 [Fusarium oxysporum f. sp. albedinis]